METLYETCTCVLNSCKYLKELKFRNSCEKYYCEKMKFFLDEKDYPIWCPECDPSLRYRCPMPKGVVEKK